MNKTVSDTLVTNVRIMYIVEVNTVMAIVAQIFWKMANCVGRMGKYRGVVQPGPPVIVKTTHTTYGMIIMPITIARIPAVLMLFLFLKNVDSIMTTNVNA